MNDQIVSDGAERFRKGGGHREALRELRRTVEERHAPALAGAGFVRRWILRCRIEREFSRERKRLFPSSQTLYGVDGKCSFVLSGKAG